MTSDSCEWHQLDSGEAAARLQVDPAGGLSAATAHQRLDAYGANVLPEGRRRSLPGIFLAQFRSPLIYILFLASAIALALAEYGDAAVILVVVVVNAVIGTFQEGRAQHSMAALRKLFALDVAVIRDGQPRTVPSAALVPGDILVLSAGDAVAADARLLQGSSLATAEAALTGESLPVAKSVEALPQATPLADRSNMVFSGTHVTAGRGLAVVVATGLHTEVGRIALMLETADAPKTPLELRIAQFGRFLLGGAAALFAVVMAFGVLRELPLIEVFMVAVSQMVSMVPEGLPVAMTVALAVGMQRMAARGAIVRRLAAVETLGSTSVICTDKTGTLTRNEMTATALWLPDERQLAVSGAGYAPEGDITERGAVVQGGDEPELQALLEAAALCNDARLVEPDAEAPHWGALGDPTEAALLTLAKKGGLPLTSLRDDHARQREIPFDAEAKMMATHHDHPGQGQRVLIKGAPEAIVALCGYWRSRQGLLPLDDAMRQRVDAAAHRLANEALRVLALAEIRADRLVLDVAAGFEQFAGRAALLGLVGQMDPPRSEARAAVAECASAGIRPVMVTGDHKATGLAIARLLGIARADDRAVDGTELAQMSDEELRAALAHIPVFARVHPAQKLRIVQALQTDGQVVAMTGDGVNDAPALAQADVGVAMGVTGTEVAKNAADIVITDDSFPTIVTAVAEGRLVYGNLQKVILYLFATSMAEIAVLLLALMLGYPLPLAAVQILWINLVTEGTITVNLVMEPPEGNEMQRRPIPTGERLLNRALLQRTALMTPVMALSTFGYFLWRLSEGLPYPQVQTETFTVLAACQWFNVLNCRSATRSAFTSDLLKNRWLVGGLALSIALQGLVIYWPPMNTLFHTAAIPAAHLALIPLVASLVLWCEELRKLIARRTHARKAPTR